VSRVRQPEKNDPTTNLFNEWCRHIEEGLSSMARAPVHAVMRRQVTVVGLDTSEPSTAAILAERGLSWAPVVDQKGRLRGIVSLADLWKEEHDEDDRPPIRMRGLGPGFHEEAPWRVASELMRPTPLSVHEDATLADAAARLTRQGLESVPCTDDRGHLVGMLHAVDILDWLLQRHTADDTDPGSRELH
jgi:CBS domain-containing protein